MPDLPNNQPPDQVWISREEYDRLKAVEYQHVAAPVVYSANTQAELAADTKSTPFGVIQVLVGAILALASFAYPGLLIVFALFALVSVYDYNRSRRGHPVKHRSAYLLFLFIPLVVVAAPILLLVIIIAIFSVQCQINPCSSS